MMAIFEEMGFTGNLDFMFVHAGGEVDLVQETKPEGTVEEDHSDDDEMDVDELERRMWRDRMLLRRLKEQTKGKEGIDTAKQRQSQEQACRKKMSRAQDGILKYKLKMMEVCKDQGFDTQRQSQEQARRKKMFRAQDGILKYQLKMMEVCKAQGFDTREMKGRRFRLQLR